MGLRGGIFPQGRKSCGLGMMCRGVRRMTTVTHTHFFSNGNIKKMNCLLKKALKGSETLEHWFLDSSFTFKSCRNEL